jgi:glycosyltransferase involved in cell wall biosynthesis
MLTIVIPYYKIVFFEKTLLSLANQTNKNFKVVIGNDNSSENPIELINQYSKVFKIKYKKFETNLGGTNLIKQWQRCLESVDKNSWISILGDDDVLDSNVVEQFYKNKNLAEDNNTKVIRFATQKINQFGEITSSVFKHPEFEKSTDFLIRKYKHQTRSSLSEYVFKNDITANLNKVSFPLAWNSDVALVLEHSNFENVLSINDAIVSIRISDKSISGSYLFILQKNSANNQFASYIFTNLNKFTKKQQAFLIAKFENNYLNNKKNVFLGLNIAFYHLYHFEFIMLSNFLKRFTMSFFKKP